MKDMGTFQRVNYPTSTFTSEMHPRTSEASLSAQQQRQHFIPEEKTQPEPLSITTRVVNNTIPHTDSRGILALVEITMNLSLSWHGTASRTPSTSAPQRAWHDGAKKQACERTSGIKHGHRKR